MTPDFFTAFYAAVEAVRVENEPEIEIEVRSSFIYDDGTAHHFSVLIRRPETVLEFDEEGD